MAGKSRLYELAEHGGKLIEKAKALLSVEENRTKTYKKSPYSLKCPNCNAKIPINAKYCGYCGKRLKK